MSNLIILSIISDRIPSHVFQGPFGGQFAMFGPVNGQLLSRLNHGSLVLAGEVSLRKTRGASGENFPLKQ